MRPSRGEGTRVGEARQERRWRAFEAQVFEEGSRGREIEVFEEEYEVRGRGRGEDEEGEFERIGALRVQGNLLVIRQSSPAHESRPCFRPTAQG